jgi:hypothetical protein
MKITKQHIITKIHLIISVLIVVPVSFVYGFNPGSAFDIHLNTLDEQNIFKAIMGLYLGFSMLWLLGIFRASYLKVALASNIIFMLGLGSGRLLSLFLDGTPSFAYQFGTFAELFVGFYGLWAYNFRYNKSTSAS